MQQGKTIIDIKFEEVLPLINWTYFFRAWKMSGKYDGIETICDCTACRSVWLQRFSNDERRKAEEALTLFRDAQAMLRSFRDEKALNIRAMVQIFPARSTGEDIVIIQQGKETVLPMLRQQQPAADGCCYSLADFINPKGDFIGIFACSVQGAEQRVLRLHKENDPYGAMLVQTLADRLAEAASEWLHYQTRTRYWGYHPHEPFDPDNLRRGAYPGIRPAVGYPSLPDQSIIFDLNAIMKLDEIGITLTENGAMKPASSVCGLYFAHPLSRYFMVGKADVCQVEDYARRRGKTTEEMNRWLTKLNL